MSDADSEDSCQDSGQLASNRRRTLPSRISRLDGQLNALNEDMESQQRNKRARKAYAFGHEGSLVPEVQEDDHRCLRIVRSPLFDILVAVVILANTVLVGVEQSYDLAERLPLEMMAVESGFLLFYIVELVLRFLAFGVRTSLGDGWIRFDIILLIGGILFTWILSPQSLAWLPSSLTKVSMLRTARIFRLARIVRLVMQIQSLWMLWQGVLHSANIMLSVLVVLTLIVYFFACIGFDMIGKHELLSNPDCDEDFREQAELHFSSLFSSMLTILSFLMFDSVRQIYWPLIEQDPALLLYFMAVIFLVGLVVANLITAIIVNGAMEEAAADRQHKAASEARAREDFLAQTLDIFRAIDEDGSGVITRDEVDYMSEKQAHNLENLIKVKDPAELFAVLDWDDSGEVEMDEFLKVVEHISSNPDQNLQFLKIASTLKSMHQNFSTETKVVLAAVQALGEKVEQLTKAAMPSLGSSSISCEDDAAIEAKPVEVSHLLRSTRATAEHDRPKDVRTGLPEATPSWASTIYKSLLQELERSTTQILLSLHRDSNLDVDVTDARKHYGEEHVLQDVEIVHLDNVSIEGFDGKTQPRGKNGNRADCEDGTATLAAKPHTLPVSAMTEERTSCSGCPWGESEGSGPTMRKTQVADANT
eukprot:TRINITY_DN20579_c0_g1_i2.p1 TRINITY_DN20579_c0_g1~~TRINITY_DN20579_c0_g1_i2.p1  ORF type:complete len:648 (-),score=85.16 TRINITY_DN20579_c0_g1_i2:128-2071(-)